MQAHVADLQAKAGIVYLGISMMFMNITVQRVGGSAHEPLPQISGLIPTAVEAWHISEASSTTRFHPHLSSDSQLWEDHSYQACMPSTSVPSILGQSLMHHQLAVKGISGSQLLAEHSTAQQLVAVFTSTFALAKLAKSANSTVPAQ